MKIESQSLTTCEVAPDGNTIVLGFLASDGRPARIRLPLNEAGTLAVTLPNLLSAALRSRYGDQSLRYVYPLVSWRLEQSADPATVMMTLGTMDGFSVCFSMEPEQQSKLGEALTSEHRGNATVVAH